MANSHTIAQMKYDDKNTRFFRMKLNKKNDARIIEKLESVDNMQGYIKSLILKDIGDPPDATKYRKAKVMPHVAK